jgi:hypothetical protein
MPEAIHRVVCAACQRSDGKLVLGIRHIDTTMLLNPLFERGMEQGFVDNLGHFLTRSQAWEVAEKSNQIIRRVGGDTKNGGTLYSENLY